MEFEWRPSIFARFFAKAKWVISVGNNQLKINQFKINLEERLTSARYINGMIWGRLELNSKDVNLQITGLPKKLGNELEAILIELPKFSKAKLLLDKCLRRNVYFRNLDIRKIQSLVQGEPKLKIINSLTLLPKYFPKIFKDVEIIVEIANNNLRFIDQWNEKFINFEKTSNKHFFDTVESTPLTDEQVIASLVMEDNNLVIASAGSGKTSTLIAKTGYAIKKGYARSDEILILSYNNAVKVEIQERLNSRLGFSENGISSPDIDTFHGFGNKILKTGNAKKRLAPWITTEAALSAQLSAIFQDLISKDVQFAEEAATFITVFQGEPEIEDKNICEFTETSSILELTKHVFGSVSNNSITLHRTLSGNTVRSYQEMRIANWLSIHGIEFKYEKEFDAWKEDEWSGGYRPDYYYPNINCWHEHFGLNKFGKAPEHWASKEKSYEEIAENKRSLLNQSEVKWFETRSSDFDDHTWDEKLYNHLVHHGETPKFIGWDRFLELAKDTPFTEESLIKLLATAIKHFKGNKLSAEVLETKALNQSNHKRYVTFINLFKKVFDEYENLLISRNEIDFEDMLIVASDLIQSQQFIHNYKLILIDEFQDISNVRAEMIHSLLIQSPETRLFAVGDDWQSIYRFAGSDINVINEFSNIFGVTKEVKLTTTFRCNQGIADVSSQFIQKNPAQKKKTVIAHKKSRNKSIRVVFHSGSSDSAIYSQLENLYVWANTKNKMIDVCLLGRYRFLEPANFTALADRFKNRINLTFSTIHSVKGLGFDAVIILGMTDRIGVDFPSTKQDDPVLSIFMPKSDALEFAEERRLFYVALTRAKTLVSLITPKHESSKFIREVLKSSYPEVVFSQEISDSEKFEVPLPIDAASQKICPKCRKGRLLPRISKYGPWMVCENSNKNLCDFKQNGH